MLPRLTLACWLLLLFAGSADADSSEGLVLRYKFRKGEELTYVVEHQTVIETKLGGAAPARTDFRQTLDLRWKVEEVDKDGIAEISAKMLRCRVKVISPLVRGDYDTRDDRASVPAIKILAQPLKALIGEEVRLRVDNRGLVREFKLSGNLKDALDKLKTVAGAAGAGNAIAFLTEDGLKGILQLSGAVFPEEPILKGKSWSHKVNQPTPFGKLTLDARITAQGTQLRERKKLEKLASQLKGTFTADPKFPAVKLTSASGTGAAFFDPQEGRLIEATLTQNTLLEARTQGQASSHRERTMLTMKLAK